jgi:hypothetical protein
MGRAGWLVVGVGVAWLLLGCDDSTNDNAKSVSGPGIDVHCAGLLPGQNQGSGVVDTSVKVACTTPP